jgi:hypothetical protein
MFCSACGNGLTAGQAACPRCGAPLMSVPPPTYPGFQFEMANYASKMRALSTVWFIYGAVTLVFGVLGMAFFDAWMANRGPWMHGPWMHGPWAHGGFPFWFAPTLVRFGWMYVIARSGLAIMAGWGLMERASWGRIVAIIAGFFNILHITGFPFSTAIGIWTLVMLLGYRNNTLYDRLTQA